MTWAFGSLPGERDFLVDLGQPRPETADGPLQRGIAADDGALAAEVPGGIVPVLDIDQPEVRSLRQEDFERADVQALGSSTGPQPARLAHQRGLGPFFEHDQRVAHVNAARVPHARPEL